MRVLTRRFEERLLVTLLELSRLTEPQFSRRTRLCKWDPATSRGAWFNFDRSGGPHRLLFDPTAERTSAFESDTINPPTPKAFLVC